MPRRFTSVVYSAMLILSALISHADAADVDRTKPVKVFILSGQSNMQGQATVTTLDAVLGDAQTRDTFKHLKPDGKWAVRKDVWVTYLDKQERPQSPRFGPLTVGYGIPRDERDENNKKVPVATIGPELGIGWVLGDHYSEPVLLIKAAWGGRALKHTFRPPSAMPTDEVIRAEVAALKARKPDSDVTFESHKEAYGSDYRKIISETERALKDIEQYVPGYTSEQGYEIAGFIWFQGWNDMVGAGNPDYTQQLAHFIRDIRRDLKTSNLPFVIGELGAGGVEAGEGAMIFRKQQAAAAELPEFKGNVAFAKTAIYWPKVPDMTQKWNAFKALARANETKPKDDPSRIDPGLFYQKNWVQHHKEELKYTSDRPYHYLGSAACYYQMGESMGRAMVEMLKK